MPLNFKNSFSFPSAVTAVVHNGKVVEQVISDGYVVFQAVQQPVLIKSSVAGLIIPAKKAYITAIGKGGKGGDNQTAVHSGFPYLDANLPDDPTIVSCKSSAGELFRTVTANAGQHAGKSSTGGSGRIKGGNGTSSIGGNGAAGINYAPQFTESPIAQWNPNSSYTKNGLGGVGFGAGGGGAKGYGGGGSGYLVETEVTSPDEFMILDISLDTRRNPGGTFSLDWGFGAPGCVIIEWD